MKNSVLTEAIWKKISISYFETKLWYGNNVDIAIFSVRLKFLSAHNDFVMSQVLEVKVNKDQRGRKAVEFLIHFQVIAFIPLG